MLAYCEGIAYNICMQYTIRGVPDTVDAALRERARREGKSLNETAIAALAEGVGLSGRAHRRRDLGHLIGRWKPDAGLEQALAEQDRIDPELWR